MQQGRQALLYLLSLFSPAIYLLYAKLEEEFGLARHAMSIYDRATKAVPADEQLEVSINHLSALSYFFSQINNMHVRTL